MAVATPLTAFLANIIGSEIHAENANAYNWVQGKLIGIAEELQSDLLLQGYKFVPGVVEGGDPELIALALKALFAKYASRFDNWFWNESSIDGKLGWAAFEFLAALKTGPYSIVKA